MGVCWVSGFAYAVYRGRLICGDPTWLMICLHLVLFVCALQPTLRPLWCGTRMARPWSLTAMCPFSSREDSTTWKSAGQLQRMPGSTPVQPPTARAASPALLLSLWKVGVACWWTGEGGVLIHAWSPANKYVWVDGAWGALGRNLYIYIYMCVCAT